MATYYDPADLSKFENIGEEAPELAQKFFDYYAAVFKDGGSFDRMAGLIRTFIDKKIWHVQINVVSSDILRDAQREPEKYRDLVVKVAGYNAFFVLLHKDVQNDIITRTEHKL